jgi:stage V sporulation protein G
MHLGGYFLGDFLLEHILVGNWETIRKEKGSMQITDVRVRKITKEGKMKAVVSITFNDEFVVHDIKIIEGEKGLFIAMPSRKAGDGEYRDIAHPLNTETREQIQGIILDHYQSMLLEEAAAEV